MAGAVTAREVARRVLQRVASDSGWATLALDAELRRSDLPVRERALAAELTYGVLRHQMRLDAALSQFADMARAKASVRIVLRVAAYQLLMLDRVPAYAAVDDAVAAAKQLGGAKVGGFVNAVLRRTAQAGFAPLPGEASAALAMLHSTPSWLIDEVAHALRADTGDASGLADAVAALNAQPPLTLRVNRRKATRAGLLAELTAAGVSATSHSLVPDGIVTTDLGDPSLHPRFIDGTFTVQDAAAQRVAVVAAPQPGQRVLDACCGVGGKSGHLAELMDDSGQLDAVDVSATKLRLLGETMQRLGHRSVRAVQADLTARDAPLASAYDVVVLDAPCSGSGVLRRHPDAKWRMQPSNLTALAATQTALLDALLARVAPGGALIYSVCSLAVKEGAGQIAAALARHPQWRLVAEERTWPHRDNADAFYLARLERA